MCPRGNLWGLWAYTAQHSLLNLSVKKGTSPEIFRNRKSNVLLYIEVKNNLASLSSIPFFFSEESFRGVNYVPWFLISMIRHRFSLQVCFVIAFSYCSTFVALGYYSMENIWKSSGVYKNWKPKNVYGEDFYQQGALTRNNLHLQKWASHSGLE